MSWIGWLNIVLLQWLCVRLSYQIDEAGNKCTFGLLKGVVPLTGWWSEYKRIGIKK